MKKSNKIHTTNTIIPSIYCKDKKGLPFFHKWSTYVTVSKPYKTYYHIGQVLAVKKKRWCLTCGKTEITEFIK